MANVSSSMLDSIQSAVIEQNQKETKQNKYDFDKLKMFFGEDYEVNGIKIVQPTIGDILEIGEKNFYHALSPFTNNSTSIRLMLWTAGVDWCNVRDIEAFYVLMDLMVKSDDDSYEKTLKLVFPNIDITQFVLYGYIPKESDEKVFYLYNEFTNTVIQEKDYMHIAEYIREMLNIHPKVEKAKGKTTKKWMIDEDRMKLSQRLAEGDESSLLPLVSSLINHPGFKYNLQELKQVGIVQFYDAIQRLQIYEGTRALLQGSYSGFCDLSKVDKSRFNFMRSFDD